MAKVINKTTHLTNMKDGDVAEIGSVTWNYSSEVRRCFNYHWWA